MDATGDAPHAGAAQERPAQQVATGPTFGSEVAVEEIMAQVQAAAQGQTDGSFMKNAENTVFRVSSGAGRRAFTGWRVR